MTRLLFALVIAFLLSTSLAIGGSDQADDEPVPIAFKIAAIANREPASLGTRTYAATYGSGGDEAKFIIVLFGRRVKGVSDSGVDLGIDISFSSGSFRHVTGSNPGPFLKALAKALEAKSPKLSKARAETLSFDLAILGPPTRRDPHGGFDGEPGDWVTTKLFLAGGNAEVFFNFNPVTGDAEFSIKDEDYGNLVVEEMSKVLW